MSFLAAAGNMLQSAGGSSAVKGAAASGAQQQGTDASKPQQQEMDPAMMQAGMQAYDPASGKRQSNNALTGFYGQGY